MAYEQHQRDAQNISARCAVITLSDTRTEATDKSGQRIREMLIEAGHTIADYKLIPDDPQKLSELLKNLIADALIEVILTNGGTGISRRDQTIDVISRTIERPLHGFGELFRMLSYNEIGSGAMLSRAIGGVSGGKIIFAMPGSTPAVELAMTKLIIPEIKHLLREVRK